MVLKKTLESPLDCKEIKPVNPKGNQSWIFIGRTDAEAEAPILWQPGNEELTHWKRPWCWERLKARGEGSDRGWDGLMALPTQRPWAWTNSRRQWRTGKPGVLQSMGLQRVIHDWATEKQKTRLVTKKHKLHSQINSVNLSSYSPLCTSVSPFVKCGQKKIIGFLDHGIVLRIRRESECKDL